MSEVADICVAEPSKEEITSLLEELGVSPQSNLIGVLQYVQDRFGYLPRTAIEEISRRTRTRLSRVYAVISFYAQFYTEPRGQHTVRCCNGTSCYLKGARSVVSEVERILGIKEGESTPDMKFSLEMVACLGACFLSPAMMVDDEYYGKLTPQRIESILTTYREK